MKIDISANGPRDPQYVLEVAEAFAQCVRALNHLTLAHEALEFPAEAHALLGYLSDAASGLPQLFDQLGRWYAAEHAAGRLRTDDGTDPAIRFAGLMASLEWPAVTAAQLQSDLNTVTAITSHLGAAEDGADDG